MFKNLLFSSCVQEYSNDDERKIFEERLKFPCTFTIKVIGENTDSMVDDTVACVANIIASQPANIPVSTKLASGGKYVSISVQPLFISAQQIYQVYELLSKDARIKFVL